MGKWLIGFEMIIQRRVVFDRLCEDKNGLFMGKWLIGFEMIIQAGASLAVPAKTTKYLAK